MKLHDCLYFPLAILCLVSLAAAAQTPTRVLVKDPSLLVQTQTTFLRKRLTCLRQKRLRPGYTKSAKGGRTFWYDFRVLINARLAQAKRSRTLLRLRRACQAAAGGSLSSYGASPDQGQTDDPLVDQVSYPGQIYYIDCDNGDDNHTGLSPQANTANGPWKTVFKVNTKTKVGYWDTVAPNENTDPPYHEPWSSAESGSAFLFKRGCSFDGFINVHAWNSDGAFSENFTFGAYGQRTKARPIIHYLTPSTRFGGSTVSTNGHQIHIRNLHLQSNPEVEGQSLWLNSCSGCSVSNSELENATADGITADYCNDLLIENSTISNNSNGGGRGGGFAGGEGSNLRIVNNTFLNNGRDQIGAHNIYVRFVTDSLIDGNLLSGGSNLGLVLHGSSANVTISRNDIYGNSNGLMVSGYNQGDVFDHITIEKNKIHDNGYRANEQGYGLLLQSLTNSTVRNNLIYGNRLASFELSDGYSADASSSNVEIYQNSFYDPASAWGVSLHGAALQAIFIKNNIFEYLSDTSWKYALSKDANVPDSEVRLDYNLYYMPNKSGTQVVSYNEAGRTLAELSSLFGQESHGLSTNPLFADEAQNDFRLQAHSPAIDRAEPLSISDDFDGCQRGAKPDIGAYEFASR